MIHARVISSPPDRGLASTGATHYHHRDAFHHRRVMARRV
jgi:hypothetical protein